MPHRDLLTIQSLLSNHFTYFKDNNILVVSEDKAILPFMYLIVDKGYKNKILMSIAVDYPNSINVAKICTIVNKVKDFLISDSFFINPSDGQTYFDEEALIQWDLQTSNLETLIPISQSLN